MTQQIKPMLACKVSIEQLGMLHYPMVAQPKLDGIRTLLIGGVLYSRTLKPIRNKYIQEYFARLWRTYPEVIQGFDGEIIVGDPTDRAVCMTTDSGVMSADGKPDFTFNLFDSLALRHLSYSDRRVALTNMFKQLSTTFTHGRIQLVPDTLVCSPAEVEGLFENLLAQGHEGCILRSLRGLYKYGRSTLRESYLLKIKPFVDDEATIIGFEELEHNYNDAYTDKLGYTKRTAHSVNKVAGNMLGALVVSNPKWEYTFKVGSGFDMSERTRLWVQRESLIGKTITFKHLATGAKDRPRCSVFKCFRSEGV